MQETNLYTITIPSMLKMLDGLSKMLDKVSAVAETKKTDWMPAEKFEEAILNDRLIFDQFPFIRQVQIACDNAKNGVARIAEVEAPKMEDSEKTVAELKARIQRTIEYLKTIKPEHMAGKDNGTVTLPYFPENPMPTGGYAAGYLLPNFYFHVTTAYSILRKNGLDIGKTDYINGLPTKEM